MAFKTYTTYGKHRKRVVKTELWISPENKAFSSCSDSDNTASERENEQFSSNSSQKDVDNSPLSFFISRKQTSTSREGTEFQNCGETKAFYKQKRDKNTLFLEHSTPLSTRTRGIKNHLELEKISPLTTLESYQGDCSNVANITEHNGSSSLFSDTSTELNYSTSLNKENCKVDLKCYAMETKKSYQSSSLPSNKTSKMIRECSSDNNQNLSSEAQSISDKMKNLKLFDVKVCLDAQEPLCFLPRKTNKTSRMAKKESKSHQENGVQKYVMKNDQDFMFPAVTPLPVINQHLKNLTGKNLSFVEALTPIRFQQQKILSAKEKILLQCEQERPLKFTEVLTDEGLKKCVKVGEGTYGEVFKTNDGQEDIVLKIIPIEGNFTVNDEEQKSFEGILPEIVISKELSNLGNVEDVKNSLHSCPNFIKVKRVMLIQDIYPEKLLTEWDEWKKTRPCENERPDMFTPSQYFIVFEFVNGGEDLETFQFSNMEEALSVLQQIVLSLCVAEQSFQFEHRDLHWGNVLIKRTKSPNLQYKLHGKDIVVASNGVVVSLIDFTLSRLTKDGITVFCDLSTDSDIFIGKGDYQFEVYRLMRKANKNDWESYVPYSNILWIRYLVDKIINSKKLTSTTNKALQRNMRTFLRRVLSYNSALEATQDDVLELEISMKIPR